MKLAQDEILVREDLYCAEGAEDEVILEKPSYAPPTFCTVPVFRIVILLVYIRLIILLVFCSAYQRKLLFC